jgi:L-threonylcarbamoyladenylate synthase
MFFDVGLALAAVPEIGPRTRAALTRILPARVTVLLPNPAERFPLACGPAPGTLGLRVPRVEALHGVRVVVLQSSANLAGGPDTSRLDEVPEEIRAGAELVIDGGELPGTPSTVVDLRRYEESGQWGVARTGAVPYPELAEALNV